MQNLAGTEQATSYWNKLKSLWGKNYFEDRIWGTQITAPTGSGMSRWLLLTLCFCCSCSRRQESTNHAVTSSGAWTRLIVQTQAMSCWLDKEAALFIWLIHLQFFLVLILFPNNPLLFSHTSSLKLSEGNKSQLPL